MQPQLQKFYILSVNSKGQSISFPPDTCVGGACTAPFHAEVHNYLFFQYIQDLMFMAMCMLSDSFKMQGIYLLVL